MSCSVLLSYDAIYCRNLSWEEVATELEMRLIHFLHRSLNESAYKNIISKCRDVWLIKLLNFLGRHLLSTKVHLVCFHIAPSLHACLIKDTNFTAGLSFNTADAWESLGMFERKSFTVYRCQECHEQCPCVLALCLNNPLPCEQMVNTT